MPVEPKQQAELRLHTANQVMYDTYGVRSDNGTQSLVRPEGTASVTRALHGVDGVEQMLQRVPKVP